MCRSTRSDLRCLVGRLASAGLRPVALVVITTVATTMVVSPAQAGADQVSNLKTQAAQLSQDLVLEQLQIGAHQQQYAVDSAKVQQDDAEIGSTQKQISSDVQRVQS